MEYYKPEERLIILGGGHVSWPLALFGAECGFAVTVVDDRPSFANRERFPKARQILCESFERCFDKLHITSSDYVAVVTRGHRYDMECLRKLLSGREPAYVGMMGSSGGWPASGNFYYPKDTKKKPLTGFICRLDFPSEPYPRRKSLYPFLRK